MPNRKRGVKDKKLIWVIILLAFNLFLFGLFVAVTPANNITSAAYPKCIDSDPPSTTAAIYNNVWVRGTVTKFHNGQPIFTRTDFCATSSMKGYPNGYLIEQACGIDGWNYEEPVNCADYGAVCQAGRCIVVDNE